MARDTKVEVVTALQSLYYLEDTDLQIRPASLYGMSEPAKNSLQLVKLRRDQHIRRPNLKRNDHFITLTGGENDLILKFALFSPMTASRRTIKGQRSTSVSLDQKK